MTRFDGVTVGQWSSSFPRKQPHDVPVLVAARLLKPLGTPQPNSVKYFAATEVLELAKDRAWLAKMNNAVSQHWRLKNQHKAARPRVEIGQPMEFSLPA